MNIVLRINHSEIKSHIKNIIYYPEWGWVRAISPQTYSFSTKNSYFYFCLRIASSQLRRYCGARRLRVCVSVRPAATARRNAALVSAAKVIRCIQWSLVRPIILESGIRNVREKSLHFFHICTFIHH